MSGVDVPVVVGCCAVGVDCCLLSLFVVVVCVIGVCCHHTVIAFFFRYGVGEIEHIPPRGFLWANA